MAVRGTGWAKVCAGWLTARGVSPDRISQASLVFAALAFLAFWGAGVARPGPASAMLILAALCVQGRLLCNLFDGMVAVEGGRSGPAGAFWNEVPDRPADVLILAGAGLACGALWLGLLAAAGAVMTAYLRALSVSLTFGEDFSGPFAKPQRMAAVTIGAVVSALEVVLTGSVWVLTLALVVVAVGTFYTAGRRALRLLRKMEAAPKAQKAH
ncbi:MAG: CDP-alcohol phosphatidyltransferase family protein [Pseudomonadota bacterium]